MKYVIGGIILWNFFVCLLYGLDKNKAIKGKWRIKEESLLRVCFLMGGIGGLVGMILFRHKIKQVKFRVLVPVAVFCNIATLVLFYYIFFLA